MNDGLPRFLLRQFDTARNLLDFHLAGLTTEECLWQPAPVGLHLRRTPAGSWQPDWPKHEGYDLGPPSIAWLLTDWREALSQLTEDDLRSPERTRWPYQDRPFGDVACWVNVELTKNAAEIGYARFLHAIRR